MNPGKYIYEHPRYYEIGFCQDRIGRQVEFMLNCFRKNSLMHDPKNVLDNGCGTGRYLEKFAQIGLSVCGYDLSMPMVEYASAKLAKVTRRAKIFKADMRDFKVSCHYDLAICTHGSFQQLYTFDEIASHLQCVSIALKKKGLYIIPLPTPEDFIMHPPGSINSKWSYRRGNISVTVDFTYKQGPIKWITQTFSGLAKIAVDDNGRRFSLYLPYRYRIFFVQELEALMEAIGCFEVVDFYGDYDETKLYSAMRRPKHLICVLRNKR